MLEVRHKSLCKGKMPPTLQQWPQSTPGLAEKSLGGGCLLGWQQRARDCAPWKQREQTRSLGGRQILLGWYRRRRQRLQAARCLLSSSRRRRQTSSIRSQRSWTVIEYLKLEACSQVLQAGRAENVQMRRRAAAGKEKMKEWRRRRRRRSQGRGGTGGAMARERGEDVSRPVLRGKCSHLLILKGHHQPQSQRTFWTSQC
mmetsp:Transcript_55805/g.114079  ORF Transcript_55805/g.114079 Transcript_55805/m.114079 type:complete len:200 (+) Transcript_55805:411-1010(+)